MVEILNTILISLKNMNPTCKYYELDLYTERGLLD